MLTRLNLFILQQNMASEQSKTIERLPVPRKDPFRDDGFHSGLLDPLSLPKKPLRKESVGEGNAICFFDLYSVTEF